MSLGHCLGHMKTQSKSGQHHSVGLGPELSKSIESELRRRHACAPSLSALCHVTGASSSCLDLPTMMDWNCELNKPPLCKSCFCQGVSS